MNKRKIIDIAKDTAQKNKCTLIELVIRGNEKNPVIEIFVDNESGVNTEDCAIISTQLSEKFDEMDDLSKNYRLDVSSPGLDRPLVFLFQYKKHVGRKFELTFDLNGQKTKKNLLLKNVNNEILVFSDKDTEIELKFEEIKKAKVLASF